VVDRLIPGGLLESRELAQRHQATRTRPHAESAQRFQVGLVPRLELESHRDRLAGMLAVQVRGILAGNHRVHGGGRGSLTDSQARGAFAVDPGQQLGLGRFNGIVDVHDTVLALEYRADFPGGPDLAGVVRPVHLRDNRRQHRRTGGHFDNFHIGPERPADFPQGRAQRQRDIMARPLAKIFL